MESEEKRKKFEERRRLVEIKHNQNIEDETFRVLNQFEKVIKKKDTIKNLINIRRMPDNASIGLLKYYMDWGSNETKANLCKLIDEYQKHDSHFCYIKFLSDKTKPGFNKDTGNVELESSDVKYTYGLIIYYIEDNEYHRFIFAPIIDRCDLFLRKFDIIDNHQAFNFIKIDKPLIKKEMKKDSSLKLLISLPGGGYASIPSNRMTPKIRKEQRLINDFKLRSEELKKAVYYEGRKCPKCKKGKTLIRVNNKGQLFVSCDEYPNCRYVKTLDIWSHKDEE